ncbi:MAG: hypothetical protein RLZZ502_592 [Pseudomonadota bacterium]
MYESEATQFLKQLKKDHPHLEQGQRDGRLRLWDKAPLDLDERARQLDARVAQKAYPYQTKV